MPGAARYEIEIRGRMTERILRPVVDEFCIDESRPGVTRIVGTVRDPSQLHGLLAHFTSFNVEVVGLRRLDDIEPSEPTQPPMKGTPS